MAKDDEFVSYLLELLKSFGTVRARAMFGGYGLYPYYLAPLEALEDDELMSQWAQKGFAAALRSRTKKK
ncbi:MAG: hypothetical protein V2J55_08250 [Candidatus Competibacteraceae bacterium]|jgi:TfoX/Sxy family transcriptional regulator of competence genes|nr:hypothetical protein [Candidatus Competibacteraceae bacterium]